MTDETKVIAKIAPTVGRSRDPTPDPALLEAFVAGDREAIRLLAERYWRPMRRWAWLELRDVQLAEDAVQEALIRMLRFHANYQPHRSFETWLRALVRNAARDQRPMRRVVVDLFRRLVVTPSPDRHLDLVRASDRVDVALEELSPRQRHLVDLCLRQERPVTEAAAALGITPSTARVHLHNARRRLAASLGADFEPLLEEVGS